MLFRSLAAGSAGSAWLVIEPRSALTLKPGVPLSLPGIRIVRIGPQSVLALSTGRVEQPLDQTSLDISGGIPAPNALVGAMVLREVVPPDES